MRFKLYQFTASFFLLLLLSLCTGQGIHSGGGSQGGGKVAKGGGGDLWTTMSVENRFKDKEECGFLVATQKITGRKEMFSYVCIVKHQHSDDDKNDTFRFELEVNSGNSNVMHCMYVKGYGILVDYSSELSEDHARIAHEAISINGKKVDISRGRIFVIDLETSPIKVRQIKFEMPIELRHWEPRAKIPRKIWARKIKQALEKNNIDVVRFEVAPQKNCEFKQSGKRTD